MSDNTKNKGYDSIQLRFFFCELETVFCRFATVSP